MDFDIISASFPYISGDKFANHKCIQNRPSDAKLVSCFAIKSKVLRNCQEPPRTDKNQKLTNADLRTTHYSTPSTKLDPPRRTFPTIRGRRCSRRMAHSDYSSLDSNFLAPRANKNEHRLFSIVSSPIPPNPCKQNLNRPFSVLPPLPRAISK